MRRVPSRRDPIPEQPEFLTMRETRQLLRIGDATLRRLMEAGKITSLKVAHRRLVARSEIDRYLASVRQPVLVGRTPREANGSVVADPLVVSDAGGSRDLDAA
jgi:excisionase family DNA binding protein